MLLLGEFEMEKEARNPESSTSERESGLRRRSFVGGIATLGAGVAGALLPDKAVAQPVPGARRNLVIASDPATIAETTAGRIRGCQRGGIYIFKGVPYGAPTSGARRFMPPAMPEPWQGIRNALQYGRVCPTHDSAHFSTDGGNLASSDEDAFLLHRGPAVTVPGEDCLRVNVWTPEIKGSHRRPVMVYMHGGGFSGGNGHDLLSYDGESLARHHDVVVVTHNHRLNVFGYLNLSETGGADYASSANVGMLDLVAVLEWVRDNIATFGGDPRNVTIFGQSGGGGKVIALMAMPSAKGLFHRAIVQSGPFLKALSPSYSARVAELTMSELGLSRSQVSELQSISVDRLLGAATEALKKIPSTDRSRLRQVFGETGWGPTVDGHILPRHPFDPDAPQVSAAVPLLTGTNLHEFVSGVDQMDCYSMTLAEVDRLVREAFGDRAAQIIDAFRRMYPKAKPFDLYATIAAAPLRHCAMEQAARKAALGGAPAYAYIYSWRTPMLNDRPGSFHASEIAFAFDNAEICDHYSGGTPQALALSSQMSGAWVNFARTGNPNHAGLPSWPAYTAKERATMYFDTPCQVRNDPEGEGLRLIATS
jgi:para-nitrobenzyl esterase